MADGLLDRHKGAAHIAILHGIPLVQRHVRQRISSCERCCIDQDVDFAMFGHELVHRSGNRFRI